MPTKSWKVIGPVTVKAYNGASYHYDNIIEAVKGLGEWNISKLKHGYLGYLSDWYSYRYNRDFYKTWTYAICSHDPAARGDSFILIDELGFTVPVWKVKEVWASVVKPEAKVYSTIWRGRKWNRQHLKCKRTFRLHHNWSVEDWEDLGEREAHRLSNRGKPSQETAPSQWDDCELRCPREKNWKAYRRTQYKKVN